MGESIHKKGSKINTWTDTLGRFWAPACIVLSGSLCFGAGMLVSYSKGHESPVIRPANVAKPQKEAEKAEKQEKTMAGERTLGQPVPPTVVASKTGKKYYYPWCATARRIKEENKVTFENAAAAEKAGYTAATNCKAATTN